ncbi:MAG: dethiobiotin synthase, partial [Myxococcaceae bacterium]|nr:dethiobiotin synthase [Myxococcaceae bacterium]
TGCGAEPSPAEDGVLLAQATGQRSPRRALRRFRAPLAPALAAELEGTAVVLEEIVEEILRDAWSAEVVLVEGAGGLLSPMGWSWNAVDLARALDAAALVVASDRLGCINHALLTLGALDAAGVRVAGLVLSAPEVLDESTGANAAAIGCLWPGGPVWVLSRGAALGDSAWLGRTTPA